MICSLARNLSIDKGLVKNARVIIDTCEQHSIGIHLLNHDQNNNKIYLPRITFSFTPKFCSWSVEQRQFPLRPAYATRFNSSQGLTLDRAVLDLSIPVFTHGQLYTGVSRVRTQSSIAIILQHNNQHCVSHNALHSASLSSTFLTLNIVYQVLLQ